MPKGADIGKWNRKNNAKNAIELVLAGAEKVAVNLLIN